jgi:hypothetical protein
VGGWGEGGQPRIRQGLLGVQANMLQAVQVPPVVKALQSVWPKRWKTKQPSPNLLFKSQDDA